MPFGMGRGGWFWWPTWASRWHLCHPGFFQPSCFPFFPLSREEEGAMLSEQEKVLISQLEQLRARLKELRRESKEKEKEK